MSIYDRLGFKTCSSAWKAKKVFYVIDSKTFPRTPVQYSTSMAVLIPALSPSDEQESCSSRANASICFKVLVLPLCSRAEDWPVSFSALQFLTKKPVVSAWVHISLTFIATHLLIPFLFNLKTDLAIILATYSSQMFADKCIMCLVSHLHQAQK